jgi:hypothetical protein
MTRWRRPRAPEFLAAYVASRLALDGSLLSYCSLFAQASCQLFVGKQKLSRITLGLPKPKCKGRAPDRHNRAAEGSHLAHVSHRG